MADPEFRKKEVISELGADPPPRNLNSFAYLIANAAANFTRSSDKREGGRFCPPLSLNPPLIWGEISRFSS